MKVFNIMLSRDMGGIQQSFVNYSNMLLVYNVQVLNITSIRAKINNDFSLKKTRLISLFNFGPWDIISIIYLKILIILLKPDIIIAHGNRAINFLQNNYFFINPKKIVIGVAHSYTTCYLYKCDYVIVLTEQLRNLLIKKGFVIEKLFVVPNSISINKKLCVKERHNPLIIGTLSRLVKIKGTHILLHAISILKNAGYVVKCIIGGDGSEKSNLIKLSKELNIYHDISFSGWVYNKKNFFNNIDIFCFTSLFESFGITILEAIEHSVPVIASNTIGPSSIITHNENGLLYNSHSFEDLADKIKILIHDNNKIIQFTYASYSNLLKYDTSVISKKLIDILRYIVYD